MSRHIKRAPPSLKKKGGGGTFPHCIWVEHDNKVWMQRLKGCVQVRASMVGASRNLSVFWGDGNTAAHHRSPGCWQKVVKPLHPWPYIQDSSHTDTHPRTRSLCCQKVSRRRPFPASFIDRPGLTDAAISILQQFIIGNRNATEWPRMIKQTRWDVRYSRHVSS